MFESALDIVFFVDAFLLVQSWGLTRTGHAVYSNHSTVSGKNDDNPLDLGYPSHLGLIQVHLTESCLAGCTFCHQPGGSTTCFRTIDIYWLLSDSTSHCRLELGCDYVDISDVVFCWAFGDWFCTLSAQDLNSLQPTAPPSSTCLAAFQRQALGSALSSFVGVLHRSRGESLGVGGGYPMYQVSV